MKLTVFKYRPEIDGLRAIAVIPVVLFHAGLGFSGGFTGVDVFFVISGYLITSLIIKELNENRFNLLNFWERRVRRIVPACFAMVAFTLITGSFILLPEDTELLGKSAIWQSIFSANIFFYKNINYFSGSAEEMGLLHTWSLAVEEQFYLFVPSLLLILYNLSTKNRLKRIALSLIIILSASFLYSIYETRSNPSSAFYLLPSRAWELLFGSIIAIAPRLNCLTNPTLRNTLPALGIITIFVPYFFLNDTNTFPGLGALPSCIGTALFIWTANTDSKNTVSRTDFASTILSSPPFVFIGKISYSLYLWHWPVMAFSTYWGLLNDSLIMKITTVAASFPLAYLSWKYVETPFRKKSIGKSLLSMYAYSATAIAITFTLGLLLFITDGFEKRLDTSLPLLSKERIQRIAVYSSMNDTTILDTTNENYIKSNPSDIEAPDLFVWGDSHARSALPGIFEAASKMDATVYCAWHGATPPTLRFYNTLSKWSLGKETPIFSEAVLDFIKNNKIQNVLLAGNWLYYLDMQPIDGIDFKSDLLHTCQELLNSGVNVTVLLEWPRHKNNVTKIIFGEFIFDTKLTAFKATPLSHQKENEPIRGLENQLVAIGVNVIDPTNKFLSEDTLNYSIDIDGNPIYFDSHHLSVFGSKMLTEIYTPLFSKK